MPWSWEYLRMRPWPSHSSLMIASKVLANSWMILNSSLFVTKLEIAGAVQMMCWLDSAVYLHHPALILWHFNSVLMMSKESLWGVLMLCARATCLEALLSGPSGLADQCRVCVCLCVHTSPLRITLCECMDTKGINGLEGTSWVLTGSVPWPHPLTLKHKHPPLSFPTSAVSFHWSIGLLFISSWPQRGPPSVLWNTWDFGAVMIQTIINLTEMYP